MCFIFILKPKEEATYRWIYKEKLGTKIFVNGEENDVLPFVFALWARLAEIGVRVSFITMTFVVVLIFEDINKEIVYLKEISVDSKRQESLTLNWNRMVSHNDLACRLIEQINQCFGPVLLVVTVIDFTTAIYDFYNIRNILSEAIKENFLFTFEFFKSQDIKTFDELDDDEDAILNAQENYDTGLFWCIKFFHGVVRFTILLMASHRVNSKVIND